MILVETEVNGDSSHKRRGDRLKAITPGTKPDNFRALLLALRIPFSERWSP